MYIGIYRDSTFTVQINQFYRHPGTVI